MRSTTVAVVDDESLQYLTLKYMIGGLKIKVNLLHFADGKEALEYLERYNNDPEFLPDYVFLDLNMPRINGWEFLETFAGISSLLVKNISVYVISSSIDERDRERADEHPNVKAYLVKPLLQSDIQSILA